MNNLMSQENGWVVMKFGGTSIGKFATKIAEDIVSNSIKDNKIAIVCSARSSGKKVEGTTSRLLEILNLLQAANCISSPDTEHCEEIVNQYEQLVRLICDDHLNAAVRDINHKDVQESLIKDIHKECKEISDYRKAAERWKLEINERTKDRLVSFGEKLSCRYVVALLEDRGVQAEYVDLGAIFYSKSSRSSDQDFYRHMSKIIRERILLCGNRVPVITGFFGIVPGGLMDGDIGRGYTDLCAALTAVGLKANELQIWKEVDGIFTADPNKVPTARLLPCITPSEAAELTFYGSEVIHHLTMDQVVKANPPIRIRIKNVNNSSGNGTIVVPDEKYYENSLSCPSSASSIRKIPKRPTAVTIKDKISIINVHSNKRSRSHGFFAKVFSILDKLLISVDLISTSEVHVSLAIHSLCLSEDDLRQVSHELQECGEVTIIPHMAILSLVGADMRNMVGVAGKMFSTLGENNINIEMISQGASEINISCVISADVATRAMSLLHANLFTYFD
ncbi:Aspartate kinase FUB3 [Erysiphe neolycopersici]|uniref:Aspartokinase n=1 Tax=Erysiphe neolycopersici TaxID=212602 RepID=A0A420HCX9_9PEZI|nr:Aspartate kinase FUB3 [Erysiphe neolycopersici]